MAGQRLLSLSFWQVANFTVGNFGRSTLCSTLQEEWKTGFHSDYFLDPKRIFTIDKTGYEETIPKKTASFYTDLRVLEPNNSSDFTEHQ